ncbi:hypothetical protein [Caballeronia sp. LZ034LL]|nr:hypothetical protein [Caballeronia sp. LZ034LL]MDR5838799.1 hypothetical protein [Caballeronia sp. LZ034LL]
MDAHLALALFACASMASALSFPAWIAMIERRTPQRVAVTVRPTR